ncbi:hypothetical protein QE152_g15621 [Popillia japonica]|uniref:Retrotransposon gag domain-containing protein n=2 Tax=Popillia japonica TaxID=7064 RepID=A0AAW1L7H2_POPJA
MEQLHLPSFNCNEELSNLGTKWKKWKRSFEILIQAKGIDNHVRKKNLLLHLAGSQVQDIYFTLPASEDATSPDLYTVTMDALDAYFAPKINTVYERYLFRSLRQAQNETVEQFITKLKEQGKLCGFIDLHDQIRDQVIEKCTSSKLRRKLLEKGDIQLVEVSEIAKAFEVTETQITKMENPTASTEIVGAITYRDKKRTESQKTHSKKEDTRNSTGNSSRKNPLFGREWIRLINLDLSKLVSMNVSPINAIIHSNNTDVNEVLSKYQPLFEKRVEKIKGIQVRLRLKPNAQAVFVKSRPIPFALRDRVKEELNNSRNKSRKEY